MDTELNERVALEVMGYQFSTPPGMYSNHWWRRLPDGYVDVRFQGLPNYSGNIAAAWSVVDELAWQGIEFDITNMIVDGKVLWWCAFDTKDIAACSQDQPTAPLAIVHAALDIVAQLRESPK